MALIPEKTKLCYPTFLERIHPDDRPLVEQTVDSAVHERTDWELAYRIVLPDLSIKLRYCCRPPRRKRVR